MWPINRGESDRWIVVPGSNGPMVTSSSIYCMATVRTRDHHWVPKFRPKSNTIPADVFSPVCMWNVAQHHVVSGLHWIIFGTPNKSEQLGTKSKTILPFAANQWNEKSFAVPHQTLYYIQKSYKSHFCRWYWSYTPISLGQIPPYGSWNQGVEIINHMKPQFFCGYAGPVFAWLYFACCWILEATRFLYIPNIVGSPFIYK